MKNGSSAGNALLREYTAGTDATTAPGLRVILDRKAVIVGAARTHAYTCARGWRAQPQFLDLQQPWRNLGFHDGHGYHRSHSIVASSLAPACDVNASTVTELQLCYGRVSHRSRRR
jgi:hypothetical protein